MTAAELALLASTFVASFVECVEALTIVLAMGLTRGWRAALTGTALALVALVAFTAAAGYALAWMIHGRWQGQGTGVPDYGRTRQGYAPHRDKYRQG